MKKLSKDIPDSIQFIVDHKEHNKQSWLREDQKRPIEKKKCDIVTCEQCGGRKFAVYDGSIVASGCTGGTFVLVCLDCNHQQVLYDDEA